MVWGGAKLEPCLAARHLIALLMAFGLSKGAYCGSFKGSDVFGADTVVHAMGYTGTENNQTLEITVGIDPSSVHAVEMQFPILNAVNSSYAHVC